MSERADKLRALANHPSTPAHEREAALRRLDQLGESHEPPPPYPFGLVGEQLYRDSAYAVTVLYGRRRERPAHVRTYVMRPR